MKLEHRQVDAVHGVEAIPGLPIARKEGIPGHARVDCVAHDGISASRMAQPDNVADLVRKHCVPPSSLCLDLCRVQNDGERDDFSRARLGPSPGVGRVAAYSSCFESTGGILILLEPETYALPTGECLLQHVSRDTRINSVVDWHGAPAVARHEWPTDESAIALRRAGAQPKQDNKACESDETFHSRITVAQAGGSCQA